MKIQLPFLYERKKNDIYTFTLNCLIMYAHEGAPESIRNLLSIKQSKNDSTRDIVVKSIFKMFCSSRIIFLFLFSFSIFLIVTAQAGIPGGYTEVDKKSSTFEAIQKLIINASKTTNLQCGNYQNVKVTELKEVKQQVVAGMNYEGFVTATSNCEKLKCCVEAYRDLKSVVSFTLCYCSRSHYPSSKKCFNS